MTDEQQPRSMDSNSTEHENRNTVPFVDDHEEVVDVDGKAVRRRGIYLLPNLFTTAALFCGFFAVISGMQGKFELAAVSIFFAMLFDGLDGRVARLTHTESKFGAEYDSLSDMVSFGVAPGLVMFNWALSGLGKFGVAAAFIYVACAALRLARFNTQIETADKNYFSGLASPSAAAVIAGIVWVCENEGWVGSGLPVELSIVAAVLTATIGLLMILNIPYHSFKGIDLNGRVPFVVIIAIVLVIGIVMLDPAKVLLLIFLIYAASGPVLALFSRSDSSLQNKQE